MTITNHIKERRIKMRLFAKGLAVLGAFVAATSTLGCWIFIFDEPEMPESLL